jgi:hypothetical protein
MYPYKMFRRLLLICLLGRTLSFSLLTRKSILLPWSDGPELGFSIEQRDAEEGILKVSIGVNNLEGGSEHPPTEDLELSWPDNGPGGSLSSQLWPAGIATSILLRSPEFRSFADGKDILELGCGVGLSGLVAAENSASVLLTDNDEAVEVLETTTIGLNQDNLQAKLAAKKLDWRDEHGDVSPVDIVLGSDIAYYYHLLRPIMDTSQAFMKKSGSLLMFAGQANRESQWDLYKNMRDGCYNQLTDEHEPPLPGETKMLLYKFKMSNWVENIDECDSSIDGTVPICVLLHHPKGLSDLSFFKPYGHVATDADDENIMKSF